MSRSTFSRRQVLRAGAASAALIGLSRKALADEIGRAHV